MGVETSIISLKLTVQCQWLCRKNAEKTIGGPKTDID